MIKNTMIPLTVLLLTVSGLMVAGSFNSDTHFQMLRLKGQVEPKIKKLTVSLNEVEEPVYLLVDYGWDHADKKPWEPEFPAPASLRYVFHASSDKVDVSVWPALKINLSVISVAAADELADELSKFPHFIEKPKLGINLVVPSTLRSVFEKGREVINKVLGKQSYLGSINYANLEDHELLELQNPLAAASNSKPVKNTSTDILQEGGEDTSFEKHHTVEHEAAEHEIRAH